MSRPKPRLCGPFLPDPDVPEDQQGRRACRRCGLMGRSGDAHHTLPAAPEDGQMRAAGERGDEG